MKVKDCMCENIYTVKPNCNIEDVARNMCENHIGCVPVCDENNCLVGILTDRDIVLRTVACGKDCKNTPVSEIMSKNVCACGCEDEVEDAERKMSENQIRRIPVLENEKVVGILTIGDLANFDRQIGKDEVCNTIEKICDCDSKKNAE